MKKPSLSFVIPCLNEEKTLSFVLDKIQKIRKEELKDYLTEIVVSDNSSTDKSVEIAESFGATVVHCKTRGYGAALDFGIKNSSCEYVIFADADDTYDFLESPKLFFEAIKGYDLVIGNRLNGNLKKKAMPFLHRYVGTPILNSIINFLYAKKDNKIKDCNSGFRCFRKDAYLNWNISGTGMEFASEMLVKALINNSRISHVPVTLYPDHAERTPHLKTWRDGMRHLLQILVESPKLFHNVGMSLFIPSIIGILIGWIFGPIQINKFSVFGTHTMLILLFSGVIGISIFGIGLGLSVTKNNLPKLYKLLVNLSEDKLFWFSVLVFLISIAFILSLFFLWADHGFSNIDFTKDTVFFIAIGTFGIEIISTIIYSHLIKRIKG
ncbi:glycosyltransferase [Ignavibacterium sp.]|uniref:glycosyltransferase family 2 protein n=1 Tax=Ignavibacterium sp. TaxID=2651167 RepID=UPI00307E534B